MSVKNRKMLVSMLIGLVTIFLILILVTVWKANVAADENLSEIQYKVIKIEEGDTMWEIAKETMNPGFHSEREYIGEVLRCNSMDTTDITSGHYLMIPYYTYQK